MLYLDILKRRLVINNVLGELRARKELTKLDQLIDILELVMRQATLMTRALNDDGFLMFSKSSLWKTINYTKLQLTIQSTMFTF